MLWWHICLPSSSPQRPPASSGVPPGTPPSSVGRAAPEAGFCPQTDRDPSGSPQTTGRTLACSSPWPPGLTQPESSPHTNNKTQISKLSIRYQVSSFFLACFLICQRNGGYISWLCLSTVQCLGVPWWLKGLRRRPWTFLVRIQLGTFAACHSPALSYTNIHIIFWKTCCMSMKESE